ncbi:hypothetical protein DYU11_08265 [Fibrisoma montanum]|uniref:Uncharacterized protein n=1 Tax=Fibrisoma montanum TaxID=2305895 RepID=A0A418MES9_9BACT|nr:hypothetical protein [Fibrisoma montanum]RIV25291.1 hypothetical protein DYU11_08265 [Fibrisoma montanum]
MAAEYSYFELDFPVLIELTTDGKLTIKRHQGTFESITDVLTIDSVSIRIMSTNAFIQTDDKDDATARDKVLASGISTVIQPGDNKLIPFDPFMHSPGEPGGTSSTVSNPEEDISR